MIDGLFNVVLLLAILVGLVVIHELGHFWAARRANVRVHEFGVGFPPRAKVLHRGKETLWTLNWLPIGGFVRLEGEEGESADRRAFVNQPLRTRLVILLAGVVMNFLLAWLIMSLIAGLADPVDQVRVRTVQPGSPAESIGLVGGAVIGQDADGNPTYDRSGDLILAVDGQRFRFFDEIPDGTSLLGYLRDHGGRQVTLTVQHADGRVEDLAVTLHVPDPAAQRGALGIVVQGWESGSVSNGPIDAIVIGLRRTIDAATLIVRGVGDLIVNIGNPQVAGPIGMIGIVDAYRELPVTFLFWMIALLSANLAVVNILPFPPMDGGRIAMAVAQRVSGGRISLRLERAIYLTGFVALMTLLVWISIFDLRRLGGGG